MKKNVLKSVLMVVAGLILAAMAYALLVSAESQAIVDHWEQIPVVILTWICGFSAAMSAVKCFFKGINKRISWKRCAMAAAVAVAVLYPALAWEYYAEIGAATPAMISAVITTIVTTIVVLSGVAVAVFKIRQKKAENEKTAA